MALSKSQIDRLGERLRRGVLTEDDLRLLDDYRSSFDAAYRAVVQSVLARLRMRPSGRPRKTTESIAAKLVRESIRLSQMQDIAGCRLVVAKVKEQDEVVDALKRLFPESSVVDRRERPSHGYRAVHVVPRVHGKAIEVQVRTRLEDLWAQLCEVRSDTVDKNIKYGGGPEEERKLLESLSEIVYVVSRTPSLRLQTRLHQVLKTFSGR